MSRHKSTGTANATEGTTQGAFLSMAEPSSAVSAHLLPPPPLDPSAPEPPLPAVTPLLVQLHSN